MNAFFTVETCPESNELPETQNAQDTDSDEDEDNEDYSVDNLYSIVFQSGGPQSVLRSFGRRPKVWIHYISAEEVMWDYNPQDERYDRWGKKKSLLSNLFDKLESGFIVCNFDFTFSWKVFNEQKGPFLWTGGQNLAKSVKICMSVTWIV